MYSIFVHNGKLNLKLIFLMNITLFLKTLNQILTRLQMKLQSTWDKKASLITSRGYCIAVKKEVMLVLDCPLFYIYRGNDYKTFLKAT